MSEDEEYLKLLDRAFAKIPSGFHETDRWKIPIARLEYEGKNTILLNFKEVVDSIKRDEKHFIKNILQEVGTAGGIKGNKAILKGKQKLNTINRLIKNYCEKYVICETCGKPDTVIVKEGRVHLLVCQACGTRHPVKL
ncbi:Translation initiation factor 2 subunit beta [Candidatus Lokiarchaeum ossiferum]|uniref:Translation initiation factor 2 subunit beta n=1 Tax=Candidatus Lokiarchaeum ossiferum TaxID=2951803 RepID=A0ABY6HS89_9ARCH|nr:Translation initiation factor 2 subunit beta [Candidatus Lokiarchaeum sp. B-35]